MYRVVSTNGSQGAVSTNGTMYFTRAPDQGSCADKTPVIQGRKRVKNGFKKTGRGVYQLGHPCLMKTNINKKILVDYIGCALSPASPQKCCALEQTYIIIYFSERSIYHLYILASVSYITCIFQRAYHNISLVYFSERSIYHLYISASIS